MFAGVKRRSSNIRVMQLFHELKQQFPTVPDHIVTACIANYGQKSNNNYCSDDQQKSIREILKAAIASENQESMGQQAVDPGDPAVPRVSKSNAKTNRPNDTVEEQYLCDEKKETTNSEVLLDGGHDDKPKRPHRKNHHQKKIKGSSGKKITKDETDNQQHPSSRAADYSQSSKSFSDNSNIKVGARSNQNSPDRHRLEMNEGDSGPNRNVKPSAFYSKNSESVSVSCSNPNSETEQKVGNSSFFVKRPTYLNIKPDQPVTSHDSVDANIRPSERCFDIQKLLHSEHSDSKPPRSPLTSKRFLRGSPNKPDGIVTTKSPLVSPDTKKPNLSPKSNRAHHYQDNPSSKGIISPTAQSNNNPILSPSVGVSASIFQSKNFTGESSSNIGDCKRDCEKRTDLVRVGTPTQTVTPLLEAGASVNLSLKVDCSMGLVQSPTRPRRSSVLNVTPELPWCPPESPSSQRSYTSVNLTLRPPSSEPQAPIDITSQNSSLTYSTSSFDSQKGLQSRLQITVGPSGGTVSSVRTRPKSSYIPQESLQETVPVRAGSLPDLATKESTSVISKQQVRIDRLRIELVTEKGRLIAMQREVAALENPINNALTIKVDTELEKQLLNEIKHLRGQCERLVFEVEGQVECRVPLGETNEEFYRNIYTGQRGPLTIERPFTNRRLQYQGPSPVAVTEVDGPKWNCPVCTFQNHPLLNKCEQCEMPRILHGPKQEPPPFTMMRHFSDNGPSFNSANQYYGNPMHRSFPTLPQNTNFNLVPFSPNNYIAAFNPNVNICPNQRL